VCKESGARNLGVGSGFLAVSSENSDTVDFAVFFENKRRINNIT